MTYLLISAISVLIIADIATRYNHKRSIERKLLQQAYVNKMAKIKYRLIELASVGEVNPNSAYFKFMYTATRYLIRGLWVHGLTKEVSNLDIIKKSLFDYCPHGEDGCNQGCLFDELKFLNNEQTDMFCDVSLVVLSVYKNSSLINLLTFYLFNSIYKSKLVITMNLPLILEIKKLMPKVWKSTYNNFKDFLKLSNYKNCKDSTLCAI